MNCFPAEWLHLREPYDGAARNSAVLDAINKAFRDRADISILDLACGTGSTVRALGAILPKRQEWHLIDNDAGHLAQAAALSCAPDRSVTTKSMDLVHGLESALAVSLDLVTASALLDLVSSEWLDSLVAELSRRRLPLYAALTYDGRTVAEPVDPLDAQVLASFNMHQRTDKGFGPALGPAAAATLFRHLDDRGYESVQGTSDWVLATTDRTIQEALFLSWSTVAEESLPASDVQLWLARRRAHLAQGRSKLRVGHMDCFAYPMGTR